MKKILVAAADLVKSHVAGYTRKDGTFVKEHEDGRMSGSSKKSSDPAHPDNWDKRGDRKSDLAAAGDKPFSGTPHKVGDKVRVTATTRDRDHVGEVTRVIANGGVGGTDVPAYYIKGADGPYGHGETEAVADEKPMTKSIVVSSVFAKAHVDTYTRKDGVVVQAHDDARQAAAYDHPNVVGHAEKLQGGDASKAHGMHFAGKEYSASGKAGTSMHDGTPVRHFREFTDSGDDDGRHVWMDHKGRVHADGTSEVPKLRKEHEAHQAKSAKKPAKAKAAATKPMSHDEVRQHAVKAGAKYASSVASFSSNEGAQSHANRINEQGGKGGGFVMTHPDHGTHVVVGGADSQRMEKNGYKHVRPGRGS